MAEGCEAFLMGFGALGGQVHTITDDFPYV